MFKLNINFSSINLEMRFIVFGLFLIALGNFIVLPYISYYLVHVKNINISWVALIISVRSLSQRGLPIVGGKIIDSFGSKYAMICGVFCRAISFFILGFSGNIPFLLTSSVLNGFGSALYQPAAKTALVNLTTVENNSYIFGLRNIAINFGAGLGPLLGSIFISYSFKSLVFISFFVYTIILLGCYKIISNGKLSSKKTDDSLGYATLSSNKNFLYFSILQFFFFVFYAQIEFLIPMHLGLYNKTLSGLVFTINAILVVLMQPFISRLFSKRDNYFKPSIQAIFLTSLGCFFMLITNNNQVFNLLCILIGILLFTLGEVVFTLLSDLFISDNIEKNLLGRAFSVMSIISALGILFGNSLSGVAYRHLSSSTLFITIISLFIFLILANFNFNLNKLYGTQND